MRVSLTLSIIIGGLVLFTILGVSLGCLLYAYLIAPSYKVAYRIETLNISANDYDELQQMWHESNTSGLESARCLDVKDGRISVYGANIISATTSGITFACTGGNGRIHSHPGRYCWLSPMDLYTAGKTAQDYTGIMCNEDTILIYSPDDLARSYHVVRT